MTTRDNSGRPQQWDGWKPDWDKNTASPHALQEKHAPTQVPPARLGVGRQEEARWRISDARLWDSLSPPMQDAAREIAIAFESMGRGLGFAATDWERLPGSSNPTSAAECLGPLVSGYVEWARRCRETGLSHSLVVDIVVFGFSCRALDADRGARRGTARQNLAAALSLYCKMKGWPCG